MTTRPLIWVLGLSLLGGSGCQLAEQGVHVMAYKVQQRLEDHAERSRDRRWADEAWQAACLEHPTLARDEDYAAGFKDGFVEHVWRGGNGEPPPLPPLKYRALRYQTPTGYQAIESWFSGYRQGAWTAAHGGYRDLVTGPSSLRGATAAAEVPATGPAPTAGPPLPVPGGAVPAPVREKADPAPELPPPRRVGEGEPVPAPPTDLARRWNWLDPRSGPSAWEPPVGQRPILPEPAGQPERIRVIGDGSKAAAPSTGVPGDGGVRVLPPAETEGASCQADGK